MLRDFAHFERNHDPEQIEIVLEAIGEIGSDCKEGFSMFEFDVEFSAVNTDENLDPSLHFLVMIEFKAGEVLIKNFNYTESKMEDKLKLLN